MKDETLKKLEALLDRVMASAPEPKESKAADRKEDDDARDDSDEPDFLDHALDWLFDD